MERLDYVINEDGIERRIHEQAVWNILLFLCAPIAESIEQKMRLYNEPYEYSWAGKRVRISYKGPHVVCREEL